MTVLVVVFHFATGRTLLECGTIRSGRIE